MKIDLHVHSSEVSPCGHLTVEELLQLYPAKGYDGFVLTNHFSSYAAGKAADKGLDFHKLFHETILKAQSLGKEKGFLVLGGYELRFNNCDNDFLTYGMKEEHCRHINDIFAMTPAEFGAFAAEEGILFYQAHPFRNGMEIVDPGVLFGIETLNGHPRHDGRNDIASAWAEKFHLHKIGGSDCHQLPDVGSSGIITEKKIASMEELVELLSQDNYSIIGA